VRTAISRRRLSDRTSSRLATFTVAMMSSSPAPLSKTISIGRILPTITSVSGTTAAPWPLLESGYSFSSCCAMDAISAAAVWTDTPSFSRPTP
jgi:hypothetical protein